MNKCPTPATVVPARDVVQIQKAVKKADQLIGNDPEFLAVTGQDAVLSDFGPRRI
jgi:hypothetical protein